METTAAETVPAATLNVASPVTGSAYTDATSGMKLTAPEVAGRVNLRAGPAAPPGVVTARPSTLTLLATSTSILQVAAAPLTSISASPDPHGAVLLLVPPSAAVSVGVTPACGTTCTVRAAIRLPSGYEIHCQYGRRRASCPAAGRMRRSSPAGSGVQGRDETAVRHRPGHRPAGTRARRVQGAVQRGAAEPGRGSAPRSVIRTEAFCGGRLVKEISQVDVMSAQTMAPTWIDGRHRWLLDGREITEAEAEALIAAQLPAGVRVDVDGEHDAGPGAVRGLLLLQRPDPQRRPQHGFAQGVVYGDGRPARRVDLVRAGPGGGDVAAGVDDLDGAQDGVPLPVRHPGQAQRRRGAERGDQGGDHGRDRRGVRHPPTRRSHPPGWFVGSGSGSCVNSGWPGSHFSSACRGLSGYCGRYPISVSCTIR